MGQSAPTKGQPTYEQLQEIIRRKDLAVREAYWSNTTIRSIAWLAFQARDSGSTEFSDEKYTEAASWTFKMIADQLDAAYGELEEAHRVAQNAVLSVADMAEGRS